MSQLRYLEHTLGSVLNWPQDILRYLFTLPPTYHSFRRLAVFFFGNGIPCTLASEFIAESCRASEDDLDFFASSYDMRARGAPHAYEYYDMSRGQVILVRGAECSRECGSRRKRLPRKDRVGVRRLSPARHTKD